MVDSKANREAESGDQVLAGTNDPLGGNNVTRKSKISYYYDEDFSVF